MNPSRRAMQFGTILTVAIVALGMALLNWRTPGATQAIGTVAEKTAVDVQMPAVSVAEVLGLAEPPPPSLAALRLESVQACQRLVSDAPDKPESYAVLALTYMRLGDSDSAKKTWESALDINARFAPAYLGIGTIAASRAEVQSACEHLFRALKENPNLTEAYPLLTAQLLACNRLDEALEVAKQGLKRFPASKDCHYWCGQVHLERHEYEESIACHKRAIELAPTYANPHYSLALANMRAGFRDEAKRYQASFSDLSRQQMQEEREQGRAYDDLDAAKQFLAGVYRSLGDVYYLKLDSARKAEANWLRGTAVDPTNITCREALLALYEQQSRLSIALTMANELVAVDPNAVSHRLKVGDLHQRLGRIPDAIAAYREATRLTPATAEAYTRLVALLLASPDLHNDTIGLAATAVSLSPSASSYLLLSAVLQKHNDIDGATAAVRNAIELEPDNPQLQNIYKQLTQSGS